MSLSQRISHSSSSNTVKPRKPQPVSQPNPSRKRNRSMHAISRCNNVGSNMRIVHSNTNGPPHLTPPSQLRNNNIFNKTNNNNSTNKRNNRSSNNNSNNTTNKSNNRSYNNNNNNCSNKNNINTRRNKKRSELLKYFETREGLYFITKVELKGDGLIEGDEITDIPVPAGTLGRVKKNENGEPSIEFSDPWNCVHVKQISADALSFSLVLPLHTVCNIFGALVSSILPQSLQSS